MYTVVCTPLTQPVSLFSLFFFLCLFSLFSLSQCVLLDPPGASAVSPLTNMFDLLQRDESCLSLTLQCLLKHFAARLESVPFHLAFFMFH